MIDDVTPGSRWNANDKGARPQVCKVLGYAVRPDVFNYLPDWLDGMRFAIVEEIDGPKIDGHTRRSAIALPCFGSKGKSGYTKEMTWLDNQQKKNFIDALKAPSPLIAHDEKCDYVDVDPAIGRPTKPCNCGAMRTVPLA